MITVVRITDLPTLRTRVRIVKDTPLSNPFVLNVHGDRRQIVEKYQNKLEKIVKSYFDNLAVNEEDEKILDELKRIYIMSQKADVELACSNSEQACFIKKLLESYVFVQRLSLIDWFRKHNAYGRESIAGKLRTKLNIVGLSKRQIEELRNLTDFYIKFENENYFLLLPNGVN